MEGKGAGVTAFPDGDNMFSWLGTINAPADTVRDDEKKKKKGTTVFFFFFFVFKIHNFCFGFRPALANQHPVRKGYQTRSCTDMYIHYEIQKRICKNYHGGSKTPNQSICV
jgi:hypothetical protein